MCGTWSVLCAVFRMCHVLSLVCVMLPLAATILVASLRVCFASLGRERPNKDQAEGLLLGPGAWHTKRSRAKTYANSPPFHSKPDPFMSRKQFAPGEYGTGKEWSYCK